MSFGLAPGLWHDAYHVLLTMPWRRFFALVFAAYLAVNSVFAVGYWALGDATYTIAAAHTAIASQGTFRYRPWT